MSVTRRPFSVSLNSAAADSGSVRPELDVMNDVSATSPLSFAPIGPQDELFPEEMPCLTTSVRKTLSGISAVGCYLSAGIHLTAYGVALLGLWFFGIRWSDLEPETPVSIAASLADETVEDDAARLDLITELNQGETESKTSIQQLASHLRTDPNGTIDVRDADAIRSMAAAEDSAEEGGQGSGLMFKVPESGLAVTKGSFTAWTEPRNPAAGQTYLIIIEIRLPTDVTGYRLSDLSGSVRGTDDYTQKIPVEPKAPFATRVGTPSGLKSVRPTEMIDVINHKVQLAIRVPGASRMTRDTIRIRSKRLREEQELTLVFGQMRQDPDQ